MFVVVGQWSPKWSVWTNESCWRTPPKVICSSGNLRLVSFFFVARRENQVAAGERVYTLSLHAHNIRREWTQQPQLQQQDSQQRMDGRSEVRPNCGDEGTAERDRPHQARTCRQLQSDFPPFLVPLWTELSCCRSSLKNSTASTNGSGLQCDTPSAECRIIYFLGIYFLHARFLFFALPLEV